MEKKIVITLGRNGSRKVEVFGMKGPQCQEATKFLENIFGEVKDQKLKNSYYEDPDENTLLETDGLPGGGGLCG